MRDPATVLLDALSESAHPPTLGPLLVAVRDVLADVGVEVQRVQIPLNRQSGFRHPTFGLVLATWSDDRGIEVELVTHDRLDKLPTHGALHTPFGPIVMGEARHVVHALTKDSHPFAILDKLRDRGFVSYCAVGLPIPTGAVQPMSVASRSPLDDGAVERILCLCPLFSLAVYAAYRTSQAYRVAESYIGPSAGPRVLDGDIKRGSTRAIDAGIVFCDIRGFTPLSAKLGAAKVVEVVNEVFAVVGSEAETRGGEILKFIGDAMLVVFPVEDDPGLVARAMVQTARASLQRLRALDRGVQLGFGGHIGQVVQGNIGTPKRLDFTVMGPAVNLASRLEGLSGSLGVGAVFSKSVAQAADDPELVARGAHSVKGVERPVPVWVLE